MTEKEVINLLNKRIEIRNKLVDRHNKDTRIAFGVALGLLIVFMLSFEYFTK